MKPTLVFVSGFGFYASMWDGYIEQLSERFDCLAFDFITDLTTEDNETLIDNLVNSLPQQFYLCGWSLGGQLALAIAKRYPHKVSGMLLLATAPSFTGDDLHLPVMPEQTFSQFGKRFSDKPKATWQRYKALQSLGARLTKPLNQLMAPHLLALPSLGQWQQGFKRLEALSMWDSLECLSMPSLFIYFANDKLVLTNWHETVLTVNNPMVESILVKDAVHASVFQKITNISALFQERLL